MDKLLQHYFNGSFLIPTSTANVSIDPNKTEVWSTYTKSEIKVWARFDDMPNGARRATLDKIRRQGILQITLFCEAGIGEQYINEVADEILDYYGTEKEHLLPDKTVLYVMSSHKNQGKPDLPYYMLPITIDYHII